MVINAIIISSKNMKMNKTQKFMTHLIHALQYVKMMCDMGTWYLGTHLRVFS